MFGSEGIDHSRVRRIAERLVGLKQTIAISESSAGGLISAALLTIPAHPPIFSAGS
jgi:nicotinamide mononucleotide (NMN) deamidase PncC